MKIEQIGENAVCTGHSVVSGWKQCSEVVGHGRHARSSLNGRGVDGWCGLFAEVEMAGEFGVNLVMEP